MDILNEYFEVVDDDVYYTFRGEITRIKGGIKNPLYGKRVNLSEMYRKMIEDISEYIDGDEFFISKMFTGKFHICDNIRKLTTKKYGVSYEWVYNVMNKCSGGMTTDTLFEEVIRYRGGVDKVNWMRIYGNMTQFYTDNESILMYIGNEILKGRIYEYFVDRYNLRVVGAKRIRNDKFNKTAMYIVLKWDIEDDVTVERLMSVNKMVREKRDWWRHMTYKDGGRSCGNRDSIKDYDLLLAGRDEDMVLPDRCPIDNNIVMNYTGIDFSDKDNNVNVCKNHDGMEEVWSPASIDRIDSNKPYTYDNVEIISQYYNTQVKNCASVYQISKLHMYQINKIMMSIHRNEVDFMNLSDKELTKFISLYDSVLTMYGMVIDKTDKYMDEYKRRNPEVFEEENV